MELTVTQRRENGLLDRTEVYFRIVHSESGTPGRADIRKALASSLNTTDRIVVLDWARSEFGRSSTHGYAKVYKSKDDALALESRPILIRNGLLAAAKKEQAPKEAAPAAPPPRREEKPKEAAKPEPAKKEAPVKEEKKEDRKEAPKAAGKPEKKEEAPKAEKKETPKKEAAKAEPSKEKKAAKKEGR